MLTYWKLIKCAVRSRLTGLPYKINVNLTWKCNSKCVHCSIWQIKDFEGELDVGEYRKLFTNLRKNLAIVSFSGGQPTMKRNLEEIILSAVELLPNLSLLSINTNALTPAADLKLLQTVFQHSPRLRFDVSISLDGLEPMHDRFRGVEGNFAKVDELFGKLQALKRRYRGLNIGFSTTISKMNIGDLEELVEVFPEKDFHTFDFYHVSEDYFGDTPTDGMLLERRDIDQATSILKHRRVKGPEDMLNRAFLALAGRTRRQPPCTAGRSSISVYPRGEIKRCYFLPEVVGQLRESDFDVGGIMRSRKSELRRPCKQCWNTCQAYTTLIDHPLTLFRPWLSWFRGDREQRQTVPASELGQVKSTSTTEYADS